VTPEITGSGVGAPGEDAVEVATGSGLGLVQPTKTAAAPTAATCLAVARNITPPMYGGGERDSCTAGARNNGPPFTTPV